MAIPDPSRSVPLQARPARVRPTDPRVPHPSWRQTIAGADQGGGRIANAGDFWARLGI